MPRRIPGWICRDTGIGAATKDVAGAQVAKPEGANGDWTSHDTDIAFTFVKEGTLTLEADGGEMGPPDLGAGDAFVIPHYLKARYLNASGDYELIEVTLPASFNTTVS